MATRVEISPEEYLRTSFEGPDRELVDGEVVERGMPTPEHAETQWRLAGIFFQISQRKPLKAFTELRLQLTPERFRVPDLAVYFGSPRVAGPAATEPPDIVAEVVSPDDRYLGLMAKLEEYRTWGVSRIWVLEPAGRRLQIYDRGDLRTVEALEVPELDAHLTADEVFPPEPQG